MPAAPRDYLLSYNDERVADTAAVELVCTTALTVLRPAARRAWVSNRAERRKSLTVRARQAHLELVSMGSASEGVRVDVQEVDLHDDGRWDALVTFAPWSTLVLLSASPIAAAGQDVLLIEDAGALVAVRLHEADAWLLEVAARQGYQVTANDRHLSQRRASAAGPTLSPWEATRATAPAFVGLSVPDAHQLAQTCGLQLRVVDVTRPAWLTSDLRPERVTLFVRAGRVERADAG